MIKNLLSEIENDVIDIKTKQFDYVKARSVPNRYDTALTFEKGENKTGKELETCVLFVDIRNSVVLNKKHTTQTMGRIYSIFTKSILKAAKYHNGHIRNIIGDRVMIVFDPKNCFTNAIECACTINNISDIINLIFTNVDFKCGIGIDYGNLKVLKIGLHRKGSEVVDNKNLVWVGYPANIASRLTDNANKQIITTKFNITYESKIDLSFLSSTPTFSPFKSGIFSNIFTETLTQDEFCQKISFEEGKIKYTKGEFISFTKIPSFKNFKKILITKNVFSGFKTENPNHKSIKENLWKIEKNHNIKDVNEEIYESSIQWKI